MAQEGYEFVEFPGEPIILCRLNNSFSVGRDLESLAKTLTTMLDSAPQQMNYVANVRSININFGDMVTSISMLTRGDLAVLKHPKIKKIIGISDNSLIQMAISAIGQQAQYGNIKIVLVKSEEEGLKQARDA